MKRRHTGATDDQEPMNPFSGIGSIPVSGGPAKLLVDFSTRPSPRSDFAAGGGYVFFTIDDRWSNVHVADVKQH